MEKTGEEKPPFVKVSAFFWFRQLEYCNYIELLLAVLLLLDYLLVVLYQRTTQKPVYGSESTRIHRDKSWIYSTVPDHVIFSTLIFSAHLLVILDSSQDHGKRRFAWNLQKLLRSGKEAEEKRGVLLVTNERLTTTADKAGLLFETLRTVWVCFVVSTVEVELHVEMGNEKRKMARKLIELLNRVWRWEQFISHVCHSPPSQVTALFRILTHNI